MFVTDRLTLDAPKRTKDNYMLVRARAARTGVQDYLAGELPDAPAELKPNDTVRVYREADEVFNADSVRSFIGRPITDGHPAEAVTADNWKEHSRGAIMGAMRDKEYLAFDLLLMDASAIKAVENGKRELSNGYACTLDWTPGVSDSGEAYDARQVGISGNHVALVEKGRAGENCAIKDGESFAICDANTAVFDGIHDKEPTMKKIVLDGLQVDLTDADAVSAAFDKLQAKVADAETAVSDANAKASEAGGKVAALEKQLADAKADASPEALDARVADRAALIADAKRLDDKIATDGVSDADLRKAAVVAKLGDAAAEMDDAAISGAFQALLSTADKKPVESIAPKPTQDAQMVRDTARSEYIASLTKGS